MKKAEAGDLEAQYAIGDILIQEKSYTQARAWLQKAAAQGFKPAMKALADASK